MAENNKKEEPQASRKGEGSSFRAPQVFAICVGIALVLVGAAVLPFVFPLGLGVMAIGTATFLAFSMPKAETSRRKETNSQSETSNGLSLEQIKEKEIAPALEEFETPKVEQGRATTITEPSMPPAHETSPPLRTINTEVIKQDTIPISPASLQPANNPSNSQNPQNSSVNAEPSKKLSNTSHNPKVTALKAFFEMLHKTKGKAKPTTSISKEVNRSKAPGRRGI